MSLHYIYGIENLVNGKWYIGLTNDPRRRKNRHFTELRCKVHDNKHLERSFHKYGEKNFKFKILFEIDCTRDEIGKIEQEYIKKYGSFINGYNCNIGGFQNSGMGTKFTKEDTYYILSAIEFGRHSRCGGALSKIFDTNSTTILRIKNGEVLALRETYDSYHSLTKEEKKNIYLEFIKKKNFEEILNSTTACNSFRKISKNEVFMILEICKHHDRKISLMARKLGVAATGISLIRDHKMHRNEIDEYLKLNDEEKDKIYREAILLFGI